MLKKYLNIFTRLAFIIKNNSFDIVISFSSIFIVMLDSYSMSSL